MKSFSVTFRIAVDDEANILSLYEGGHEQDVRELIEDVFYDIDDVHISSIKIQERYQQNDSARGSKKHGVLR